jgi:glycosyltransferase involved in cell wall biosynthesis
MEGLRSFALMPATEATFWLLDRTVAPDVSDGAASELEIVDDRVVVDVDHAARHDLHTGIQQVVRQTLPLWTRDHPITMVAWSDFQQVFRALSGCERDRVLRDPMFGTEEEPARVDARLIVPWHTVVVLAETPPREACERLAALAQYSGNSVVAIGYDCIPMVSADLVPPVDSGRFVHYLTIIKYAHRVAGISASARAEFEGFSAALPAQGVQGPTVVECALPAESVVLADEAPKAGSEPRDSTDGVPLVLSVGSFEPRKNHLALLYAAEVLWREGHTFDLLFIGGSGWGDEVPGRVAELQEAGRPIEVRRALSDGDLAAAYRRARFTVFPSLHEGYGLPVAESLSLGTPVITSDFGSTREIGAAGGTILIDARDDAALVDAMRILLTDDARLGQLRDEIARRPERTWEQYAAELWEALVVPALAPIGRERR